MKIEYSFKLILDNDQVVSSRNGLMHGDISKYAFDVFDSIEALLLKAQDNFKQKEVS